MKKTKSDRYALRINKGLFFKEDFMKLSKNVLIYIEKGCLIVPSKKKKKSAEEK